MARRPRTALSCQAPEGIPRPLQLRNAGVERLDPRIRQLASPRAIFARIELEQLLDLFERELFSLNFVPDGLAATYGGPNPTGLMGFVRLKLH